MRIAMFTNTYLPHVGGVARSVKSLQDECRKRGHEVRIIAPQFENAEELEDVLRVPAIQNFNGSDFSFRLPVPALVRNFMDEFQPDLIHSHHPFLLGDSALREAWKLKVPIVFTHHTLYERYTHYVPLDSEALKRVAIQLTTEYCNLCDKVIAPSESIAHLLGERGVMVPVESIPTGIDTTIFADGDAVRFRETHDIPTDAFVIGHVGRLAQEKNLVFLAEAVARQMDQSPNIYFLLVGDGPEKEAMLEVFKLHANRGNIIATGSLGGSDLVDAYAAMDLFVFSSQSETQGMVLAEAMAAGAPVVALDGPGVREIVVNDRNGILLKGDATVDEFSEAISRMMSDEEFRRLCIEGAVVTAKDYDLGATTDRICDLYDRLIASYERDDDEESTPWDRFLNGVEIEWELAVAKVAAVAAAMNENSTTEARLD